jgi:hypothetical protein
MRDDEFDALVGETLFAIDREVEAILAESAARLRQRGASPRVIDDLHADVLAWHRGRYPEIVREVRETLARIWS